MDQSCYRVLRHAWLAICALLIIWLSACGNNAAVNRSPAAEALEEARAAAGQLKNYSFKLHMDQQVEANQTENVKVEMEGLAEREPLRLDQTIHTTINGESDTIRTVIVPEGYYMYLPDYEEWSKLSAQTAADNTATLSDFQADPGQAIEAMLVLAEQAVLADNKDGTRTVRYAGTGAEAKTYAMKLLQSTLGLTDTDLDERLKESMRIEQLALTFTMDARTHNPLSYEIENRLTLEFEAGKATTIDTAIHGSYSDINESEAVVLPEEARGALDPDELDKELGDDPLGLNEEE